MSGHKFGLAENVCAHFTMLHQFTKYDRNACYYDNGYDNWRLDMNIDQVSTSQQKFQMKYNLLYICYRIISSLEQFAGTTKLDDANSRLLIAPQVALGIYDVNETFPMGFAVFNGTQTGSGNAWVMPINEDDFENATFIESGIILSDGVIDLVKTFKGR